MSGKQTRIVIIGGVAGGASAATRARRMNEHAQIIMLEKDRHVSFANCGLPYYLGGEITEREKNAALLNVLENKLQDIQTALRSIEKGSYGICARCGNPIEPGRLEVKPDATHCVQCQSEVERLSRRGRQTRQINW